MRFGLVEIWEKDERCFRQNERLPKHKREEKEHSVHLGMSCQRFTGAKVKKGWKVHLFTQQLIIEQLLGVLCARGTVVDKTDKSP